MSIYAISDIRGYYNKFLEMLSLINYDTDDCLILVGNSIDKDNEDGSIEIVKWIINQKHKPYNKLFVLMGINEKQFIDECIIHSNNEYYSIVASLISNGITMEELDHAFNHMRWRLPMKKWSFANSCTCDEFNNDLLKIGFKSQKDFCLYSTYDDIINYGGVSGYWNVFGHYPTTLYYDHECDKGRIVKFKKNNKRFININCGVYLPDSEGSLGCICIDDEKEYYVI